MPNKKEDIFLKIRPIIAEQLEIKEEKIELSSRIVEDLGVDSLDATELLMALEEAFNMEIMDDEAEKLKTINDVVNYLSQRLE